MRNTNLLFQVLFPLAESLGVFAPLAAAKRHDLAKFLVVDQFSMLAAFL
jgi:hypothetical protein